MANYVSTASIAAGLRPFREGNVSETSKGLVQNASGSSFAAIVKDLPAKELFNELVASAILKAAKLPAPTAYLGRLADGPDKTKHAPLMSDGARLLFVSTEVGSPSLRATSQSNTALAKSLVSLLCDWDRLGEVYSFDAWVANVDRHTGNILLSGSLEVWLIDHGYMLTGPKWRADQLDGSRYFRSKLEGWLTPNLSPNQRLNCKPGTHSMENVARTLDIGELVRYVAKIVGLSAEDQSAVEKFLRDRSITAATHAQQALNLPRLVR